MSNDARTAFPTNSSPTIQSWAHRRRRGEYGAPRIHAEPCAGGASAGSVLLVVFVVGMSRIRFARSGLPALRGLLRLVAGVMIMSRHGFLSPKPYAAEQTIQAAFSRHYGTLYRAKGVRLSRTAAAAWTSPAAARPAGKGSQHRPRRSVSPRPMRRHPTSAGGVVAVVVLWIVGAAPARADLVLIFHHPWAHPGECVVAYHGGPNNGRPTPTRHLGQIWACFVPMSSAKSPAGQIPTGPPRIRDGIDQGGDDSTATARSKQEELPMFSASWRKAGRADVRMGGRRI